MRFPQKVIDSSKSTAPSYNLFAYSKVKSHDFDGLIKISEQLLSILAEPHTNTKTSPITFYLKPLYNHYDDFYKSCLTRLRSSPITDPEILKNLRTILHYEYVFSKEAGFLVTSEDVSQLVELLLHIEDPDLLILILRILAEKLKEADYMKDWEQESLRWQVILSRVIQVYYEFFSEVSFDLLLENFSSSYSATIERFLLTSLSNKIKRIPNLGSLNNLLQELITSHNELNDKSMTEIKNLFTQGRIAAEKHDNKPNPDFYEAAAIMSLLNLARNYSQKRDAKLLNFLIVTERVRLSLSLMKSPIFLQKLKSPGYKWPQLAFRCLDILNADSTQKEIPLEYFGLLQDLVPVYKFLLLRSRTNNQIFAIYTFNTILKNLKLLSSRESFCLPVNTLLDEALIEWLTSIKRCIFLGYDKLVLEIGQQLAKFLLDCSLTQQIGPFALKKMSNFCSEILSSDDRFSASLVNLSGYFDFFRTRIPDIFNSELKDYDSSMDVILKYFTDTIRSNTNDSSEVKALIEFIHDSRFAHTLITFLSKGEINDILHSNPSLLMQILLFIVEFSGKKDSAFSDEEYTNFVHEVIKVLQNHNLPSGRVTVILHRLLDKNFSKPALKDSHRAIQYIEELLIAFFHYSVLDGTSVEDLGKYFKLSKNSQGFADNKTKIEIMLRVLTHYLKIEKNLEIEFFDSQSTNTNLSKYEAFSAEVILGPLKLIQIMLESLHGKQDATAKESLGQCQDFLPQISKLLLSPLMLFAPKEFLLSDNKASSIVKRVPYLSFLANLFETSYIDSIADQLKAVSASWPSPPDVKVSNLESFLPSAESVQNNLDTTLSLINGSIQSQNLSQAEYTLLNTIGLLCAFKEYLSVAPDIWSIKKLAPASLTKLEKALPAFFDTLIAFILSVFTSAEQKCASGTRAKVYQEWSKVLHSIWLGLASFSALVHSYYLCKTISLLVFQHLIGVGTSSELSVSTRQHFIAGACAVPQLLSSTHSDGKLGFISNVLIRNNLNALMERIEDLDAFSIANSFVKELVQGQYNADNRYTLKHIEGFYELLSNDSQINIDFKKSFEYLYELTSLQNNIRSKDLLEFTENIKNHLNNLILQQLKSSRGQLKTRPDDKDIETLLKKAFDVHSESLDEAIELFEKIVKLYGNSSIQKIENFEWSDLREAEFPIKEELLSQTIKAFAQLSKVIWSKENSFLALQKENKEDFLQAFCNLFERITHDIRAYLSYNFLQGKRDIKSLIKPTISSLLELSHLADGHKTLLDIFSNEAFFKSIWLTIYNIVLIDQDSAMEIIQNGLVQSLLTKEYLDTVKWDLSTLALSIFDIYCYESLPPRELIEVNLKSQFAIKQDFKQPLKTLFTSDFFSFATRSLEDQDFSHVLKTCFTTSKLQNNDAICEIQPDMLTTLQSSLGNSNSNVTIGRSILRNLLEPTRNMLDTLINTLVKNYSYEAGFQSKSSESKKGRRLTTELLYHLLFILIKYPHLNSYIFTKKIDPKIMRAEGLPDKFPYSKLVNSEEALFLDFILRVILKIDHAWAVLIIDFLRRSGIVMSIIKEDEKKPILIDLNDVIHSKSLQLIKEIIDEDILSGQVLYNYDSFEMMKSLFFPLKHLENMNKSWKPEVRGQFSRLTMHKVLDWVLAVDKKRFQDNFAITNLDGTVHLLTSLGEAGSEGGLISERAEKYKELLNSLIGYNFIDQEEGVLLQCRTMFDQLALEASEEQKHSEKPKRFEMTKDYLQKRLFHVLDEKAEAVGLGFDRYNIYESNPSDKNFEPFSPSDLDLLQNRKSEDIMKAGNLYFMETRTQPRDKDSVGRKPKSPTLGITANSAAGLLWEFLFKGNSAAILDMFGEEVTVVKENIENQEAPRVVNDIKIEEEQEESEIEEAKEGEEMLLLNGEGDVREEECMEKIIEVLNAEPEFAECFEQMLVNGVFQDLNKSMDRAVASALLLSALEEYVGSNSLRDRVIKRLFKEKKENQEETKEEVEVKQEDKYIEMKRTYEKYILPSSSAIRKDKFNAQKVKENWFRRLYQVRRCNKSKIEAVLLHLRYSLIKSCSLGKLGVTDLENIVTFNDEVEREYFFAEVYEYASENLSEAVKERSAQANECVSQLEKCLDPQNKDSIPLEKFLEQYKAEVETSVQDAEKLEEPETKEEPVEEEIVPRRRRRSRRNSYSEENSSPSESDEEIGTSLATRPKLSHNIVFCKDHIDYDELMPGKREFIKATNQDNATVDAKVLQGFTNFICCSDKQIESLVEFLFEDSLGSKNAKDEYQLMELFKQICINPMNEIKLLDTVLFLLLNPHLYKTTDHSLGFPYNMAQRTSVLGMKSQSKLYATFAQNALYLIQYIIKALSLRFVYIPLHTVKSFSIKSIRNLREKDQSADKTQDMHSLFDLLIAVAGIPEIRENKALEESLQQIIKLILENTHKFKNNEYSLEVTRKHFGYLIKMFTFDEVTKAFQGSAKAFMNILPSILETILSSLKPASEKAHTIIEKLKKIETEDEKERARLLEPIEKTHEFVGVPEAVYKTVEGYFNYLFRSTYLLNSNEEKDQIDEETFKVIESSLNQANQELEEENVQLFMVSIYEILDIYGRIIGKQNLTSQTLQRSPAITKLVEFGIHYYALTEMKKRLDKELAEEKELSPLPKLSKMKSKDGTSEPPSLMKRSFSHIRKEKKFDFDSIFTNFGLTYVKVLSDMSCNFGQNITGGLILLLCEKYPFLVNIDAQRDIMRRMYLNYFYRGGEPSRREIELDRRNIVDSLIENIHDSDRKKLGQQYRIKFMGESGIDQGGLIREFYSLLSHEFFDPEKGLFQFSANKLSVQPRADSWIVPNHLKLFELAGIITAKALVGNFIIDCTFTKSFLKHCLGRKITISDLEELDITLATNLKWMLENDVTDLDQNFTYETEILGEKVRKELIEGGYDITVTEDNKKEYVMMFCEALMIKEIGPQMESFLKGFRTILPARMLSHISPSDLGLLISGTPTIDLEDLKANSSFEGFSSNSKVVKWFWEILTEFTQEELASLMYFISGTSKVPVGGFKNRPMILQHSDELEREDLPVAHTCFYTLDLPEYATKAKMREKLLLAIFEGKEGFHIA